MRDAMQVIATLVTLCAAAAGQTLEKKACSTSGGRPNQLPLHASIQATDPVFWKTPEQVALRTLPPGDVSIAVPAEGKSRGPLRVLLQVRTDDAYTCREAGQRVMDWTGDDTLLCESNETITSEILDALLSAATRALERVAPALSPRVPEDEGTRVLLEDGFAACGRGLQSEPFRFDVPAEGYDADLVIFLTAAPFRRLAKQPANATGGPPVAPHAFGWPCHLAARTHRPVISLVNYNPALLRVDTDGYAETVILHELLHALGLHPSLGRPWSEQEWWLEGLHSFYTVWQGSHPTEKIQKLKTVDGLAVRRRPTASSVFDFEKVGSDVLPVNVTIQFTPKVLFQAREHFGCAELGGMELEDYTFGIPPPKYYSVHWEKRILSGDVFTSVVEPGSALSKITLAALEDTGFYRVDYDRGEPLAYGAGAGCVFANDSCQRWHRDAKADMYSCLPFAAVGCADEGGGCGFGCLADKRSLGVCSSDGFGGVVPVEYVHRDIYRADFFFGGMDEARRLGGCDAVMDHCAVWVPATTDALSCTQQSPANPVGEDCWRERCEPFSVPGPAVGDSACFEGDLRQRWVGRSGNARGWSQHGQCLPFECIRAVGGDVAVRVKIASGTVLCRKGDAGREVGPGPEPGELEYWTFTPSSVSQVRGTVVCPDPEPFCASQRVDPPFVPPILSAPYYVHEDTSTRSPAASLDPTNVHITRVLVNGIRPCGVAGATAAGCDLPTWPRSRLRVEVDGGPFHDSVLQRLWVGYGRDPQCKWTGAQRLDFVATRFYRRRAVYNGTLPHWATPGTSVHLCVSFSPLPTQTVYSEAAEVRLRVLSAGDLKVSIGDGAWTELPQGQAVALGTPVHLEMRGWGELSGHRVFYSFGATTPRGSSVLLGLPSQRDYSTTQALPKGLNAVTGRVHLYDGARMSDWFLRREVEVEVGGVGAISGADAASLIGRISTEVTGTVAAVADSGPSGETSSEAFAALDNTIDIMGDLGKAARRRAAAMSAEDAATLTQSEEAATESVAAAAGGVIKTMDPADAGPEAVVGSSASLRKLSADASLMNTGAQMSTLAAAQSLAQKLGDAKSPDGQPVSATPTQALDGMLDSVGNAGLAAEMTHRAAVRRHRALARRGRALGDGEAVRRAEEAEAAAAADLTNAMVGLRESVSGAAKAVRRDMRVNSSVSAEQADTGAAAPSASNYSYRGLGFELAVLSPIASATDSDDAAPAEDEARRAEDLEQAPDDAAELPVVYGDTAVPPPADGLSVGGIAVALPAGAMAGKTAAVTSATPQLYPDGDEATQVTRERAMLALQGAAPNDTNRSVHLSSSVLRLEVDDADGAAVAELASPIEAAIPVRADSISFPTLEQCRCDTDREQRGECTRAVISVYEVRFQDPATGTWVAGNSSTDEPAADAKSYCESLGAGIGSGWRRKVMGRRFRELSAGAEAVHLAELALRDAETGGALSLEHDEWSNPGGSQPTANAAAKAGDNDRATSWADYNKRPLVVHILRPVNVTGFSFVTAADMPGRDPVRWRLEGSSDGEAWELLMQQARSDWPVPRERQAPLAWFDLRVSHTNHTYYKFTPLAVRGTTLKVVTSRVGAFGAFLVSDMMPSVNTAHLSPVAWSRIFTELDESTLPVFIGCIGLYVFFLVLVVVVAVKDHREDQQLENRVTQGKLSKKARAVASRDQQRRTSVSPVRPSTAGTSRSGRAASRPSVGLITADEASAAERTVAEHLAQKTVFADCCIIIKDPDKELGAEWDEGTTILLKCTNGAMKTSGGDQFVNRRVVKCGFMDIKQPQDLIDAYDAADPWMKMAVHFERGRARKTRIERLSKVASDTIAAMQNHTWICVMYRKPGQNFTRVQRLVVLFTFMYTAIFTACLFFGQAKANATPARLITSSLLASAIMAPTTVLLKMLFQRSTLKPRRLAEAYKTDRWARKDILGEISVWVVEAKNLPICDSDGLSDPFAVICWENKKFKSKTAWNTCDPVWDTDQTALFPVRSLDETVAIRLIDDDGGQWESKGDLLGTFEVPMEELLKALVQDDLGDTAFMDDWFDLTVPKHMQGMVALDQGRPQARVVLVYEQFTTPIVVSPGALKDSNRKSEAQKRRDDYVREALRSTPDEESAAAASGEEPLLLPAAAAASPTGSQSVTPSEQPLRDAASVEPPAVSSQGGQSSGGAGAPLAPPPGSGPHQSPLCGSLGSPKDSKGSPKDSPKGSPRGSQISEMTPRLKRKSLRQQAEEDAQGCDRIVEHVSKTWRASLKTAILVLMLHLCAYMMTYRFGGMRRWWPLYAASALVICMLAFVLGFSKIVGILFAIITLWCCLYTMFTGAMYTGAVLLFIWAIVLLTLTVNARAKRYVSLCFVVLLCGLQVILVHFGYDPAPPWYLTAPNTVLLFLFGSGCWLLLDRRCDRPFAAMILYTLFVFADVLVVLRWIDWPDKAVPVSESIWIPFLLLLIGLLLNTVVYKARRGPVLPQRFPPWAAYVGYVLAVLIQIVTFMSSLTFVLDLASDKRANIYNGILWNFWQDIFCNEPAKIVVLTNAGPFLKTVLKGTMGRFIRMMLVTVTGLKM